MLVILKVTTRKETKDLAEMVAGRAYTIDGVSNVEVVSNDLLIQVQKELKGYQEALKAFLAMPELTSLKKDAEELRSLLESLPR